VKVEGAGRPEGCKLIRVTAEIEDGVLRSIRIRGDFFASPEDLFEGVERVLEGAKVSEIPQVFDAFIREQEIQVCGISGPALAEVLQSAIRAGQEKRREEPRGR
jgi:hypothetical protein